MVAPIPSGHEGFVPHLVVTGIVLTYKGYLEMDRELV